MGVLLYHDTQDHGMVALSEARIAGEHTPARRYVHNGHFLEVNGPAHAITHDVEELTKLGYRLATAHDQEARTHEQQASTSLREGRRKNR